MYSRYCFTVRYGNKFIFEKKFTSINQLVQVASFFVSDPDLYMQAYDDLTERIFTNARILGLCKEFYNDKVLF